MVNKVKKNLTNKKDLGDELADVLFVLTCIANQTGINLQDAFEKNMEKKTNRDFERHLNNEKLKINYIENQTDCI